MKGLKYIATWVSSQEPRRVLSRLGHFIGLQNDCKDLVIPALASNVPQPGSACVGSCPRIWQCIESIIFYLFDAREFGWRVVWANRELARLDELEDGGPEAHSNKSASQALDTNTFPNHIFGPRKSHVDPAVAVHGGR
jgi:hypothetical protein